MTGEGEQAVEASQQPSKGGPAKTAKRNNKPAPKETAKVTKNRTPTPKKKTPATKKAVVDMSEDEEGVPSKAVSKFNMKSFNSAAQTLADLSKQMNPSDLEKVMSGKSMFNMLNSVSQHNSVAKVLVASTAAALSNQKDNGPARRIQQGSKIYKKAFDDVMETDTPTSTSKGKGKGKSASFPGLEEDVLAPAMGKTFDDFYAMCMAENLPKLRGGKRAAITDKLINDVYAYVETLNIQLLSEKILNIFKMAKKSAFLTPKELKDQENFSKEKKLVSALARSEDKLHLSDFMHAIARIDLALGEVDEWHTWIHSLPQKQLDDMSEQQMEYKRKMRAGDYYSRVAAADETNRLERVNISRFAYTGRRWLQLGRIFCEDKPPVGTVLALCVAETSRSTSQLTLITKTFNETHLHVLDLWVSLFEPELSAFIAFLHPLAMKLREGKVGNIGLLQKKFDSFINALPARRYEFQTAQEPFVGFQGDDLPYDNEDEDPDAIRVPSNNNMSSDDEVEKETDAPVSLPDATRVPSDNNMSSGDEVEKEIDPPVSLPASQPRTGSLPASQPRTGSLPASQPRTGSLPPRTGSLPPRTGSPPGDFAFQNPEHTELSEEILKDL